MKKAAVILAILVVIAAVAVGITRSCRHTLTSQELSAFTGRYEMQNRGYSPYVDVIVKNGALEYTNGWDGYQRHLGYLSGDDFMVKGLGWSVKFFRNTQGSVTYLTAYDHSRWTKINRDTSIARAARWKLMIYGYKLHPFDIDTASLKVFTGSYGQERISLENGALYFIDPTGYKVPLTPISDTAFTLDNCKIEFHKIANGNINQLAIFYENGFVERYPRNR